MRAWAYYELGTLFGGVPIYKEFAKSVESSAPRSTQKEVYDLVIADLKAAEAGLAATYNAANLGRATKSAAQMLLARTYLQMGDYTNAKTELQKIVSSGLYKLADNYLDLTNEEGEFNSESILEVVYAPSAVPTTGVATATARQYRKKPCVHKSTLPLVGVISFRPTKF